jgi:hypothetical protein
MSRRTEAQRAVCIVHVEHEIARVFPGFGRHVGVTVARAIGKRLGCKHEIVVSRSVANTAWGHIEPGPEGKIVLRPRVPRFVVLHEIAHARLVGVRATDHGLRFLESYVDTVWDYFRNKTLCRALEAALRTAR